MVKSNIKFNNKSKKINKLVLILLVFIVVFIGLYVYKYGLKNFFKFDENNYNFNVLDSEDVIRVDNKIINNINNIINDKINNNINDKINNNIILKEAKKDLKEKFDSIFENNVKDTDSLEFEFKVGEDKTEFQQNLNKWRDIDNITDNVELRDYYKFNDDYIYKQDKIYINEINNIPFTITDELLDKAYHVAFTELKKKNNRLNKNYTEYPLGVIANLG